VLRCTHRPGPDCSAVQPQPWQQQQQRPAGQSPERRQRRRRSRWGAAGGAELLPPHCPASRGSRICCPRTAQPASQAQIRQNGGAAGRGRAALRAPAGGDRGRQPVPVGRLQAGARRQGGCARLCLCTRPLWVRMAHPARHDAPHAAAAAAAAAAPLQALSTASLLSRQHSSKVTVLLMDQHKAPSEQEHQVMRDTVSWWVAPGQGAGLPPASIAPGLGLEELRRALRGLARQGLQGRHDAARGAGAQPALAAALRPCPRGPAARRPLQPHTPHPAALGWPPGPCASWRALRPALPRRHLREHGCPSFDVVERTSGSAPPSAVVGDLADEVSGATQRGRLAHLQPWGA
jgi:hypothetical protein